MAELLIKVGSASPDAAQYQDGDIIAAISERRIRKVHAEQLCFPRDMAFNRDGLREPGGLLEDLMLCHRWRFARVSKTEIVRTELASGKQEMFGPSHIDVPLYLLRRTLHPRHKIFGSPGAEVWYGGKADLSDTQMTRVWNAIETKSEKREADHRRFPWGSLEMSHHLVLATDPMDDATANAMIRPVMETVEDEDGVVQQRIVSKRSHRVGWRDLFDMPKASRADVEDRGKAVDVRDSVQSRSAVVQVKA